MPSLMHLVQDSRIFACSEIISLFST